MFTSLFWRLALERAFKTFAQTLVALLSAGGIGLLNAPWTTALSAAGMAALLSLLTSVASEPWGARGTPSLLQSTSASAQSEPAAAQPEPAAAQLEQIAAEPAPKPTVAV
ncbi:MAG: holin [Pseudonocardiaceae bacterium]